MVLFVVSKILNLVQWLVFWRRKIFIFISFYQKIRDNIVKECTEAKFLSLIADEVTDKSTTEQISMCVRFMGKDENGEYCLKESFVCFTDTSLTTGEKITHKIIDNSMNLVI